MTPGVEDAETRSYGRSAGLLTIALGVAGLLTYAYFALASHSLDADEYGDVVILWSVVFLLASTLFRPIEQLLAHTLAERDQAGAEGRDAMRTAALIQTAISAVAVVGLLIARDPIIDDLFGGEEVLYWVLVASLLGFGLAYYARGLLAGRGQFPLYAALLVIEVSTRLAFAVVVALGIAGGANLIALGIATAPVACLIILPIAAGRHGRAPASGRSSAAPATGAPELTLGRGGAFASAVLVMMLSEQILVSSGVLFVRAAEGAAAAGFIFNMLMVARAPLVLFQAIAASLLPHLTRLRTQGGRSSEDSFRSAVGATLLLIAGFASATTLGVLAIGPEVMQLAFGDEFTYDRLGLGVIAVGMGFYLSAASLNQAALAQGQATRAAVCWVLAAASFIGFALLSPLDAFRSVEYGFAGSAALLAVLLGVLYLRPHPKAADELRPGSGREVEARLLSADEIG